MQKPELSDYLAYQASDASSKHLYKWKAYGGKSYIGLLLNHKRCWEYLSSQPSVTNYPWLTAFFKSKDLDSFVQSRRENSIPTTYIDYMGPGNHELFHYQIPDQIFSVSLKDNNVLKQPKLFKERTTRIIANVYDVPTTFKKLRDSNFPQANISTQTARGPLWRFWDNELLSKFPLEMVWEHYYFMFRSAYSLASPDGSLVFFQIPSINTKNPKLINDTTIDQTIFSFLNSNQIPTYVYNDVMVSVKTDSSPKKLPRRIKI